MALESWENGGQQHQQNQQHIHVVPDLRMGIMSTSRIAHASVLELISLCGSAEPTRKQHRNQQPLLDGHGSRYEVQLTLCSDIKRGHVSNPFGVLKLTSTVNSHYVHHGGASR